MHTVLAKGPDEPRRIFTEGGRAIASNNTGGASTYAPLSSTGAVVLDVEGFLNYGGCIADIKPIFGHGSLVSQAPGCVGCGPFGCSVQEIARGVGRVCPAHSLHGRRERRLRPGRHACPTWGACASWRAAVIPG